MKTAAAIIIVLYVTCNILSISWFIYRKYYKKQHDLSWTKDLPLWF